MRLFRLPLAIVLVVAMLLPACKNEPSALPPAVAPVKAAPTHAASLETGALMQLVFPSWDPALPSSLQEIEVPSWPRPTGQPVVERRWAAVATRFVVRLDETHATVVVESVPTDAKGNSTQCHACPAIVGAYFFERDAQGWRPAGRDHAVLVAGVNAEIGDVRLAPLGDGRHLLTAQWGSCWQGYCGSWLEMVVLSSGKATSLDTVRIAADNDGVTGACAALAGKDGTEKDLPDDQCMQVEGRWTLEGDQLRVHFKGLLREPDGDKAFKPLQRIDEQAVYVIGPDALELKQGRNPVPGF